MAGLLDWLLGTSPPPARPTSRGATFGAGYQGMPTSANIEDRRGVGPLPSRPHDLDAESRSRYNPFGQRYSMDQWAYLQNAMPQGQPPTTQLQDPNFSLDPSILAQVKAARLARYQAQMPSWARTGDPNLPTPMPEPPQGGQRGPQAIGTTINSYPAGYMQ